MSNGLDVKIAVLEERVRGLDEKLDQVTLGIAGIQDKLTELQKQADRWKMGLIVLASLGGIISWLLTSAEPIVKLFSKSK